MNEIYFANHRNRNRTHTNWQQEPTVQWLRGSFKKDKQYLLTKTSTFILETREQDVEDEKAEFDQDRVEELNLRFVDNWNDHQGETEQSEYNRDREGHLSVKVN